MKPLPLHYQYLIGFILIALMIATREYHFASLHSLPGASWAVFFLAGLYLRSSWSLPGFLALTWILDSSAYFTVAESEFCLTTAYAFLLPAYSALWAAGRWFATHYQFSWRAWMPLSFSLLIGAMLCELFSSGGFYFFSGQFTETNFAEFWQRELYYFPLYLQSLLFYVSMAAAIHIPLALIHQSRYPRNNAISQYQ
ncbi:MULTISPECIES: hypothetical protein [Nitrosomonas]|uniref:Cobalamin ABC transporter n=2 Tax=Nitrosomonas eutropha TaxID=916 RepID=A0ABX5M4W1_9PROT|nr:MULTISPECIES: hypothetical protein [Nitrosomonas]ABI60149.1 conserved hypothetical protein [Nitrosomonas eutropha C91]MXS80854.1 hypothetical protein [Nitrosomonas sp. GH22]PXV77571.1 hypothetical protein C8R14_12731 [Nitrosomonas eutropha]SDW67472.1 hypothetical protein SAMN05216317_11011 [Nitrosomonas eutropha]SEJ14733.1 hypothetical protein SAMN05216318_12733 [Nitrosomonas eutropha]